MEKVKVYPSINGSRSTIALFHEDHLDLVLQSVSGHEDDPISVFGDCLIVQNSQSNSFLSALAASPHKRNCQYVVKSVDMGALKNWLANLGSYILASHDLHQPADALQIQEFYVWRRSRRRAGRAELLVTADSIMWDDLQQTAVILGISEDDAMMMELTKGDNFYFERISYPSPSELEWFVDEEHYQISNPTPKGF